MTKKKLKSLIAAFRKKIWGPSQRPQKLTNKELQKYTFKFPFPQKFSLPSNILYYVAKNPKFPNGHLKLISTCKFLLRMNRILPVSRLDNSYNDNVNKWLADGVTINLKNKFFKFWIHGHLLIFPYSLPNHASVLVKQIYKFSLQEINIFNQNLIFEELEILVSGNNLERIYFEENVVKNADENVTEFEKVFALLCCKDLRITFQPEQHGINKNTTIKIIETLSSDEVCDELVICLRNIPSNFNFFSFSNFLKVNMTASRQHTIDLDFSDEISEAYKNQLQEFVNEIIQIRGIFAHTVPYIHFPGQDFDACEELWKMRNDFVDGILRKPSAISFC